MKGGKREGAGNREGSIRPKFTAYWDESDIADYHKWLKKNYKSNPILAKFVGEQLHGKAPQPLTNDEDNPLTVEHIVHYIPQRVETPPAPGAGADDIASPGV